MKNIGVCQTTKVGFLKVTDYPERLTTIVLVPTKYGKVRTYVGYRDLNKANLMDNFLTPHLDVLADNTTGPPWMVSKVIVKFEWLRSIRKTSFTHTLGSCLL